jgi:deazaflavin-dependent oxidoreductase (nitroreductase family)
MALPSFLPRYLNPVMGAVARYLPPLAMLHHTGRSTGKSYDSPVQAYRTDGGFVVGYAYSDNPGWAKNLLAVGHGQMTRACKQYAITNPRHLGTEGLDLLPAAVAAMMRGIGIEDFLRFDTTPVT